MPAAELDGTILTPSPLRSPRCEVSAVSKARCRHASARPKRKHGLPERCLAVGTLRPVAIGLRCLLRRVGRDDVAWS